MTASYFKQLAATVEELGRLRSTLRRVIELADTAPTLSDPELRTRLHVLAQQCAPR